MSSHPELTLSFAHLELSRRSIHDAAKVRKPIYPQLCHPIAA